MFIFLLIIPIISILIISRSIYHEQSDLYIKRTKLATAIATAMQYKKLSSNFRSYVRFLKAAWFLINKENLIYVSRHILSFLTYNNFKHLLKYMWDNKVLYISILYISILHKVIPLSILKHFDLVNYSFHTIYIGITYAVIQLYRSCYRGFYIFSFKSFICNIALGIFIYNLFASSLFIFSLIIVFNFPICIYECLKGVHAFFKEHLDTYISKAVIMYAFPDERWAYRNVDRFVIQKYITEHYTFLRELLTLPTSDVARLEWGQTYNYMENCKRFQDEFSKGMDKMWKNQQVVKDWTQFVNLIDANYPGNQQNSTVMSILQGNVAISIRAKQILDELNDQTNLFNNTQGNRYNENNTSIAFLRNFAQLNINNSQQKIIRDSVILRELQAKAAENNLVLTRDSTP